MTINKASTPMDDNILFITRERYLFQNVQRTFKSNIPIMSAKFLKWKSSFNSRITKKNFKPF